MTINKLLIYLTRAVLHMNLYICNINNNLKVCSDIPEVRMYVYITKTRLYNFDRLKPHFYTVKLGFTGVYIIFLISAVRSR